MTTNPTNDEQLREAVRERYGRTALEVLSASEPKAASCCGADCCGGEKGVGDAVSSDLYSNAELGELPTAATLASLGCGNPTALAELKPGEKVLDLGSGGGIDVFLSARSVGPTGFAYGLDMTDAMLELAERNRVEANVENVRLLLEDDLPFRILFFLAIFRRLFETTLKPGQAVSLAHWKRKSTGNCSLKRALPILKLR